MNKYTKIVNPKTNSFVNIYSRIGRKILYNYLIQLGGHNGPCSYNTKTGRCRNVGPDNKKQCELSKNKRCKMTNEWKKNKAILNSKHLYSKEIKTATSNLIKSVSKELNDEDIKNILETSYLATKFMERVYDESELDDSKFAEGKYKLNIHSDITRSDIKKYFANSPIDEEHKDIKYVPRPDSTVLVKPGKEMMVYQCPNDLFYHIALPRSVPLLEDNFGPNLCMGPNTQNIINPFHVNTSGDFDPRIIRCAKKLINVHKEEIFNVFIKQLANDNIVSKKTGERPRDATKPRLVTDATRKNWDNTKELWELLSSNFEEIKDYLGYQIFCQTWMRGNDFSHAKFSVASPHFQIFIYMKDINKIIEILHDKMSTRKLKTLLSSYIYMLKYLHDNMQKTYGDGKPAFVNISALTL